MPTPADNLKAAEDNLSALILEVQKTAVHQDARILREFAEQFARFKMYATRMIDHYVTVGKSGE